MVENHVKDLVMKLKNAAGFQNAQFMEAGLTGVHGAQLEAALRVVHGVNNNTSDLGVAPIQGPSTMETIAQENHWRPQAENATPMRAQCMEVGATGRTLVAAVLHVEGGDKNR